MTFTTTDLRLLICEDEYLIATDMAQQFASLGAVLVTIAASAADAERQARKQPVANAALLDVELLDGEVHEHKYPAPI